MYVDCGSAPCQFPRTCKKCSNIFEGLVLADGDEGHPRGVSTAAARYRRDAIGGGGVAGGDVVVHG